MITKLEELNINKRRDYEFVIYMDEEFYTFVKDLPYVVELSISEVVKNKYYMTLDPRYNEDECLNEIRSIVDELASKQGV